MGYMNMAIRTTEDGQLVENEYELVELGTHDVLINVKAAGVNPVDMKQREVAEVGKILGYDAVGIVISVGDEVQAFQPGDRVFYSGDVTRDGSFAQKQIVREELIALAPQNLTDEEAATMPLTFLTAYELLTDKFGLMFSPGGAAGETLLIVNGSGAVGRVMTQLAKWMGMQVIATASSLASQEMVRDNGADLVVDHYEDYAESIQNAGWTNISYIAVLHEPTRHFARVAEIIEPFGHIGMIVAPAEPVDIGLVKNKAVSIDWEFMFAKASIEEKMAEQGKALQIAAQLSAEQVLTPYVGHVFNGLTVENIADALAQTANNGQYGKHVVAMND
ncbi:zinc-binding dehydrogenase [Weissella ceti]|uniref:Zinc-binding dehydrogenase n=1 Tax=Weissella ceti TaxID=759620 RepID=A0ABT3E5T7_9LACO|nr:zinc-binding dehydrogenase [Weissella ceti]MCW0953772.1 zinc-binding dehydrogenase [Weissella ceti]